MLVTVLRDKGLPVRGRTHPSGSTVELSRRDAKAMIRIGWARAVLTEDLALAVANSVIRQAERVTKKLAKEPGSVGVAMAAAALVSGEAMRKSPTYQRRDMVAEPQTVEVVGRVEGNGGEGDYATADLRAAREEYASVLGKRPWHGWDVETLRQKIAEAGEG